MLGHRYPTSPDPAGRIAVSNAIRPIWTGQCRPGMSQFYVNREASQVGARRIQDEIFGWAVDLSEIEWDGDRDILAARPVKDLEK